MYVGGTFDLFHAGHIELLRRASKLGEVWVILNGDDYCERLKGKRPIMSYHERATVLLACEYVDMVLYNDGNERELFDLVRPSVLFYGNDGTWTRQKYLDLFGLTEANLDWLGVELLFPPRTEGVSSTDIIERIIRRHRADGGEASEHVLPAASCPCGRDEEAGRVLGDLRGGRGCPCS